jgi:hypothetical protein
MSPRVSLAASSALLALLAACTPASEDATPPHPDWIIKSHVAFYASDRKTLRTAPRESLRLWMPYVVGDIYGSPNEGEIAPVVLQPGHDFTLNLNIRYTRLSSALVPTAFSQKWMTIEPAAARVARLSPFVLPADGIQPIGMCEWLDPDTGGRLLLIYLDRPARIRGEIVHEGRNLRFDIDAREAGYVWVSQPEGSGVYRAVPRPPRLTLAVMPNA